MQLVPAWRKSEAVAEIQLEVSGLQAMRRGMCVEARILIRDGLERAVMDDAEVPSRRNGKTGHSGRNFGCLGCQVSNKLAIDAIFPADGDLKKARSPRFRRKKLLPGGWNSLRQVFPFRFHHDADGGEFW